MQAASLSQSLGGLGAVRADDDELRGQCARFVYRQFGGRRAFAQLFDFTASQLTRWTQSGVPPEHWEVILTEAAGRAVDLSWVDFYKMRVPKAPRLIDAEDEA